MIEQYRKLDDMWSISRYTNIIQSTILKIVTCFPRLHLVYIWPTNESHWRHEIKQDNSRDLFKMLVLKHAKLNYHWHYLNSDLI